MSKTLIISTLGGISIQLDNELVTGLASRKAEAILVYLAYTGRTHPREVLGEFFWNERTQERAMGNLRVALASLRKELGEYIIITRDTVAINRDTNIWLDSEQFERLLNEGKLLRAIEFYHGDFLEGFYLRNAQDFENWIVVQREHLKRLYRDGLESLVDKSLATGEYPSGIKYASQLLSHDPTRETAHRKLMRLLVYNGKRGAAIEQYQDCWRSMADGLGLEPSQETHQLYQDIVDERIPLPELDVKHKLELKLKKPIFLKNDAHDRRPAPLFVAKEHQLNKLNEFLQTVLRGQGMVAFVCGGAGRGKTALVDEFARRAMNKHPKLLAAKGYCNAYSGIGDAYLPFREIMDMLSGNVETLWKAGTITTEHARRLWAGVPVLTKALLDCGPDLFGTFVSSKDLLERVSVIKSEDAGLVKNLCESVKKGEIQPDQMQQAFLFEQLTNVLCRISEEHPLILLLDDLQWGDNGSISLLFHLGRRLAGSQILIICAYRAEEVAINRDGERHPLQKILAEFKRLFGDVCIDLSRVENEECVQFVGELLDSEPNRLDESFRQDLIQKTGGHPLYTVELLRAMQERGDLVRNEECVWVVGQALDWNKLPTRIEAVIAERIDRLEPQLQAILRTASVEGEYFSVQILAAIQKLDDREVTQLLSTELENRHHLVSEQAGLTIDHKTLYRYRFTHYMIQQYIYNRIGEGERKLLHLEIADTLQKLMEPVNEQISSSIVLQLGWHYSQAGENEKSVEFLIKGAEQAFRSHAYEESIICYRQALDNLADKDDKKRATLLYKLGETYSRLAEISTAEDYLNKAQDLASKVGDTRIEIKALFSQSSCNRNQGKYDQALDCAHQSLFLAEQIGDLTGIMSSLRLIGCLLGDRGDLKQQYEYYKKSLSVAEEINDEIGISACLNNLGIVAYINGRFEEAEGLFRQALENAINGNEKWWESMFMENLSEIERHRGRYKEALELLHDSLAIAQKIGDMAGVSRILNDIGTVLLVLGKYEEAIHHLNKGLEIAKERNLKLQMSYILRTLGFTFLEIGKNNKARDYFQKSYDNYIEFDFKEDICLCLCGMGEVDSAQGLYDNAFEKLNESSRIAAEQESPYIKAYVILCLGKISWEFGNHKKARRYLEDGLKIFKHRGDRGDVAYSYAYLGHNSFSMGEIDYAWSYYRQALKIGLEIEMMPVITETLVGISLLFSKTGKQDEATKLAVFVSRQKECSYATKERARRLLEELDQDMVHDEFEQEEKIVNLIDLEQALREIEPSLMG